MYYIAARGAEKISIVMEMYIQTYTNWNDFFKETLLFALEYCELLGGIWLNAGVSCFDVLIYWIYMYAAAKYMYSLCFNWTSQSSIRFNLQT